MDLTEQLATVINQMNSLPAKIKIAHLSPNIKFGIYPQPGSQVISEDWSGLEERSIPYEVALKTNDFELADQTLMNISELLDNLEELDNDGTYDVQEIQITPSPFLATIDVDDEGIYLLDFTVIVETQSKKIKRRN